MFTTVDTRLKLHETLCLILGSRNVYYQPPESVKMKYPAIVYGLDNIDMRHADNSVYFNAPRYSVTVIDRDPESAAVAKLAVMPMCRFNRHFEHDNLNHDVFTLYCMDCNKSTNQGGTKS